MKNLEPEAIRERIAGPEPLLLINAPAGYGKTHEAVSAAQTPAINNSTSTLVRSHEGR